MRCTRSFARRSLVALALATTTACSASASAQGKPTLSGSWSASSVSESWSFDGWVDACGPKPRGQGGGGGSVQIREQGGELSIVGAGRAWSTAECWEQAPGLGRVSHSQSGGGRFWRTRCSLSNEKERITVTTTVSATDTSIAMQETSEHKVTAEGVTCTATASRSRSFGLVKRDGEEAAPSASASASASAAPPSPSASPPPSAAASAAAPAPKAPLNGCKVAGDPARLEVVPAKKTLRPGDRFSFRTVVTDSEGCAVWVKPTWTVTPGPLAAKVTVDGSGTVTVAEGAEEGRVELVATVSGKGVPVAVEITSPTKYDALLSAGTLDPQGEQGAVVVIATGAVGGRKGVADDVGRERKQTFVAIVIGLAFALGFAGLVLMRRGRRPAETDAETDAETEAERNEEAQAEAEAEAGAEDEANAEAPKAQAPARSSPTRAGGPAGKVCPTCGERYGAEAQFCGADGTTLVPLNR
ncbi:hypothetical protein [Polyangium fumosum]|uniref:Zinc ribbon domain-containing protein n=1 Tax=Polyangium fumosum TaxID=889272 RepID=A0A4U1JIT2_9BACT|nr:hypothetical protein [Polyangium fumosum]TKD12604.1 hypothetical protein E8A74_02285 [Polyangium fumosum]